MSAGVGIPIQQCITRPVARDDEVAHVVAGLRDAREQALGKLGLGRENVFDAPRRVE